MSFWEGLLDSSLLLAVLAAYPIALLIRRRFLSRHGGTFELSHRDEGKQTWTLGLGRVAGEELQWFRIFSLGWRPSRSWHRIDLSYAATREPEEAERGGLFGGHVVVICRDRGRDVELAMSPSALTGLQAWLEAAPPGEARRRGA